MKRLLLCKTILLVAATLSGRQALAQNNIVKEMEQTPQRYVRAVQQGRNLVEDLMTQQGIPGLSVAVAVDGAVVWSEGFGFADLENRVPVSPKTRFRIGSVSKLLTAAAVARLYEQGYLDLDAPVQRYVPAFPKKDFEITTRQLAGHLAGVRHYKREEFINRQRYNTVVESLNMFKDDPLLHQPGAKYLYSTYGYTLISAVIEGASKQDYPSYMLQHLFQPLNMQGHRIYHHGGESIGGRAFLIVYPDSKLVVALLANLTFARIAEQDASKIAWMFMN